jgi:predicted kinase
VGDPVRLIVLNGLPACGKSTFAARYAAEWPLTLNLDVDRVRSLIGNWRADPHNAGLLARAAALAMARGHLCAGHDVIVAQMVSRPGFVDQLERLAHETKAFFHEVVLLDSLENVMRRYTDRDPSAADIIQVDQDELKAMYERMLGYLPQRPGAKLVRVKEDDWDGSYRDFLGILTA